MNPPAEQNQLPTAGPLARWLKWLLCLWTILVTANAAAAEEPVSKEYQIKAAYLYNFAKFVQWPEDRFANAQTPLVIGVFGRNPFGDELQAIARNHKINGRDIIIKPVDTVAEARTVHLLFMSAAERENLAPRLAALDGAGVLTVGESETFAESGGMIVFVREADKVRFHINAAAAEHARLKISAQLLKLSQADRK